MFSSSAPADGAEREYIDLKASVNKLLIVRPKEYRTDFKTTFSPEGTDVVFADIAVVDDIDPVTSQQGKVYRDQAILQGYLKGTFKRKIGEMIVGMLYLGPPQKGRPPFMWHDLFGDPNAVARATAWVTANQSFLVNLAPSAPEPATPAGPPAYVPPSATPPPVSVPPATTAGLTTLEQMRNFNFGQGQPETQIPF